MSMDKLQVLAKIDKLRKDRGMTKVELAKEINVTPQRITAIMGGDCSMHMLNRLLNIFGYEVVYLVKKQTT